MIIKDINILDNSNFITSLIAELCRQNISYVLIEDSLNDNKKCLELHFDKYIYKFHEISYSETEISFIKNPFKALNEVHFNDNMFIDDSITLEKETTKKKGKSGNKRYTRKDIKKDRHNYKISKANYKLR